MQDQTFIGSKIVGLSHTGPMAKPWQDIADRLIAARRALGYGDKMQAEYARNAGLKPKRYSNWESGSYRISIDGALALRERYGLSLDFIFCGSVAMLPNKVASALRDNPLDSHSR